MPAVAPWGDSDDVPLYHWSPTSRRKAIERRGFVPGSWSTDRVWRPPCICFAADPRLAWALSGGTERGAEHPSWDLWMMWASAVSGLEAIPFDGGPGSQVEGYVKEYRAYERIFKRDLWLVGTREP